MRRFWLFPFLFVALFLAFQISLEAVGQFTAWLSLRLFAPRTDIYYVVQDFSLLRYRPSMLWGVSVGWLFAVCDFVLHHPTDPKAAGALRHLRLFWRRAAVVLSATFVFNLCVGVAQFGWSSQRRYHADNPQFQILNLLSLVPPVIFIALILWALGKALKRARF